MFVLTMKHLNALADLIEAIVLGWTDRQTDRQMDRNLNHTSHMGTWGNQYFRPYTVLIQSLAMFDIPHSASFPKQQWRHSPPQWPGQPVHSGRG